MNWIKEIHYLWNWGIYWYKQGRGHDSLARTSQCQRTPRVEGLLGLLLEVCTRVWSYQQAFNCVVKERCVRRWPGWPKAEKKRAPLAPNSQSHSRVILDLRLCRRVSHENRIRWSEILATLRNFSSLRAFVSLRLEHWTLSSAWQISQILRRTLFTLLIGKRVALIQ